MTAVSRLIATALVAVATLAACGGDGNAEPTRSYTLRLRTDDSGDVYKYLAEEDFDIRVGDEVDFEVDITGSLAHDLQVVDPEGEVVGVAAAANPGGTTSVTVWFQEPGYYRLNCLVDNHLTEHGMQAIIEVTDA